MAPTATAIKVTDDDRAQAWGLWAAERGGVVTAPEPLPADPWAFVCLCLSQDEHSKAKGLAYIRPLVGQGDDYLRVLTEAVGKERLLRIEKSRQLRVTWLLSALMLHRALTQPGVRIGYVCRGFDSADAYLRDRMFFMYEHLPSKYARPRARYVSGVIEVFHDAATTIPTSQIQAIAEGASQVRQFTFTVLWADEFAFQFDQDELLTAAKPSLDGGGALILTSSAGGDGNAFYRLGYADVSPGPVTASESIAEGVTRWQRNGWCNVRVMFTADPHKRGDWAVQARQGYSAQAWAQEQGIDFTVTPGKPVFDCLNLIETGQFYDPALPVASGFDYSFLANVCLSGQIHKRPDGRYSLHIITETQATETTIDVFGRAVLTARAIMYPCCIEFRDFGDFAANQRTSTGVIIESMQRLGITLTTVPTGPGGVLKGIELIQHLIAFGLLEIDPGCTGLIQSIRSGYVWEANKRDSHGLPVPAPDHPHSDRLDSLRYLATNVFELQEMPGGGSIMVVKNQFRGSDREKVGPVPVRPSWRAKYKDDADTNGLPSDAIPHGQFRGSSGGAQQADAADNGDFDPTGGRFRG